MQSVKYLLTEDDLREETLRKIAEISGDAVLLVEPDPERQWKLARILAKIGRRVVGTASSDGALALLGEYLVNLVLIAENLPKTQGRYLAAALRKTYPDLPVFVIGDGVTTNYDLDSHGSGIFERLARPLHGDALADVLSGAASTAA
jgi:DNA-binding NtrC family response regulator